MKALKKTRFTLIELIAVIVYVQDYGNWVIMNTSGAILAKGYWSFNSNYGEVFTTSAFQDGRILLAGNLYGRYEIFNQQHTENEWNPTVIKKDSATIVVKATDAESGVKRIKLPNGEWVDGNIAEYLVTKSGTYQFVIEDLAGNTLTKDVIADVR